MGKIVNLENNKIIMAIDPGVTTGIAYKLPDGSYETVAIGQYEEDEVWDSITNNIGLVIYENFKCITISTYGLYTVRLIGGIIALCRANKIPIIKHEPAHRKPYLRFSKQYLREHDKTGIMIHQQDALAHLMKWDHEAGNLKIDLREEVKRLAVGKHKSAYRGLGG